MIQQLRAQFPQSSKPWIITGSPQCIVPDANMGRMISQTQFDILYIQFYNTPTCSARNWISANPEPKSAVTPFVERSSGFQTSYNSWTSFVAGTASKNAKLYIGFPGSRKAVGDGSNYITVYEARRLARSYFCRANFGGVAIWEATYAEENIERGVPFYESLKKALVSLSQDRGLSCYAK